MSQEDSGQAGAPHHDPVEKARRGLSWIAVGEIASRVFSFFSIIYLARVLATRDWGIAALAVLLKEIVQIVGNVGLTQFLIHQKEEIGEYANAAFWLGLLASLAACVILVLLAPLFGRFYDVPEMGPIAWVVAFGLLFGSLGNTPQALLTKELRFRELTVVNVCKKLFETLLSVGMALAGLGYWALIAPLALSEPLRNLLLWRMERWRPRAALGLGRYRRMVAYGKSILGVNVLGYFITNIDYLIIGRLLGAWELGLYTFAYNLANWPVSHLSSLLGGVLFPAFSKLRDNPPRLVRVFLGVSRLQAAFLLPVFFGLAAAAPLFIPVVYGDKWLPATIACQLLCIYTARRAVTNVCGNVLYAVGRPDVSFRFSAAIFPVLALGAYAGTRFLGIEGAALASAVILGGGGLILLFMTLTIIDCPRKDFYAAVWPAFFSSAAMFAVVILFSAALPAGWPAAAYLAAFVVVGGLAYPLILRVLYPEYFRRTLDLLKRVRSGRKDEI